MENKEQAIKKVENETKERRSWRNKQRGLIEGKYTKRKSEAKPKVRNKQK